MTVIATDLDRTLLPDGGEEYDGTLPVFKKIIKKQKWDLIYITGRTIKQIKKAIYKYNVPWPDYILTNVGSRVYGFDKKNKKFKLDKKWFKVIRKNSPEWNKKKIKKYLKGISGLWLQEKKRQDKFKISYYVDLSLEKNVLKKVNKNLKEFGGIKIIYSVDYPKPRGLLDIMTKKGTKKGALDYILKKNNKKIKEVLYCGDSGNDLSLLASKYDSVVVANAPENVKKQAKKQKPDKTRLYIAKKQKYLNGNYVSGIIQGLVYFKMIDKKTVSGLIKKYRKKENKFRE